MISEAFRFSKLYYDENLEKQYDSMANPCFIEMKESKKAKSKWTNHQQHLVKKSDTLEGIALKYNTTITELKKLNNLGSDSSLGLYEIVIVPRNTKNINYAD